MTSGCPTAGQAIGHGPPPPPGVLRSFGVRQVRPLRGGQNTCWVGDGLVLKPHGDAVTEWLADVLSELEPVGVRVAEPVRNRDGAWLCEGWSATRLVDGRPPDLTRAGTWVEVIEAGRALHRALAEVPRPAVLDGRTDAWARADRAAWDETAVALSPPLAEVGRRLRAVLAPLPGAQLVHGDLTTNVLFAVGSAPAVVDVSPYWRPTAYAYGIVVADALCWHGASASLLDEAGVALAAVARGLLFRLVTDELRATATGRAVAPSLAQRYPEAVAALGL